MAASQHGGQHTHTGRYSINVAVAPDCHFEITLSTSVITPRSGPLRSHSSHASWPTSAQKPDRGTDDIVPTPLVLSWPASELVPDQHALTYDGEALTLKRQRVGVDGEFQLGAKSPLTPLPVKPCPILLKAIHTFMPGL